jgi:integrase
MLRGQVTGPVFRQRRCGEGFVPLLSGQSIAQLQRETVRRCEDIDAKSPQEITRHQSQALMRTVWRDIGATREDWVRIEFMRITKAIDLPHITAPKTFRHTFATILQDANVDPLIRNELMGHSPTSTFGIANGLGMTGVYTHTPPETKRKQLELALQERPAICCAADWLKGRQ